MIVADQEDQAFAWMLGMIGVVGIGVLVLVGASLGVNKLLGLPADDDRGQMIVAGSFLVLFVLGIGLWLVLR